MRQDVVLLAPRDDVAVVLRACAEGDRLTVPGRDAVTALGAIPRGHKTALRDLPAGALVRKYGHVIGVATRDIREGEHVHTHNLAMPEHAATLSPGDDGVRQTEVPADLRRTFDGIVRPDGSVATRNHVGVLTTVNCSATVARRIVRRTEDDIAELGPEGVDGVVALTHGSGCGLASEGEGWELLRRTLVGYARHPNIGALVVVGLGCEVNAVSSLMAELGLAEHVPVASFTIQDAGGTVDAIDRGEKLVRDLAAQLAGTRRTEVGVEHLVLGLKCGGSDAWSGLTANPALGVAGDLLLAAGGASVLGETPEIYGAQGLLAGRAVRTEVADALLDRVAWWERYTREHGTTLDGNPSPGNKEGGITTILEKSLGAVAKSGHSPLTAVRDYAEPVQRPGLTFMDTPGYDPVSVTGMIAGGANVVCFTTGRGSVFGSRPVPTVKLATNADVARRLAGDMDVDCSPIVEEGTPVAELGRRIYDHVLDVASGRRTLSEQLGLGGEELVPWQKGAVL
ncbi:UxaA family hydrolase [Saccharomonospora azurea]|uniref:UxaA family hydrolase n=1 Tax=Saccharomonospora azurea TaxID=40988 RepID=UPI003D908AA7